MEWTSVDGPQEKKIIIRKGGPGGRTQKQIQTIIIDGQDEPIIWTDRDAPGRGEKRIEIIREKEAADPDGPQILRFRTEGRAPLLEEELIRKEWTERNRANHLEERVIFLDKQGSPESHHMEVLIDGTGQSSSFLSLGSGSTHSRFASQLLKEGLIRSLDNYRFDLSTKRLKVDGRRMPDAVHQRYLDLYETITGQRMTDKDRLRAEIDND